MATQVLPANDAVIDDSRYEFVRGQLIERPVPGIPHGLLQGNIASLLKDRLKGTGRSVGPEISIDRTKDSKSEWLTPDVLVSNPGGFAVKEGNQHALPPAFLAIEILSPGQTFMNLHWKSKDYIQWGVEHVWFLDIEASTILTFSAPKWGRGQFTSEGTVSIEGILSLDVADIFSPSVSS